LTAVTSDFGLLENAILALDRCRDNNQNQTRTMKIQHLLLMLSLTLAACAEGQAPPASQAPPPVEPAPPPAAPPQRSAADLEKLVAPIALYPDPLLATLLPASVYPLEIVQAARFVTDTNNLAKLDEQPWDDNVKAVARVPEAMSSSSSRPGVRRWTCGSTNAGARTSLGPWLRDRSRSHQVFSKRRLRGHCDRFFSSCRHPNQKSAGEFRWQNYPWRFLQIRFPNPV